MVNGQTHSPTMPNDAEREKQRIAFSSVLAAVFLTALKLVTGLVTGSLGILAEAANSGLDVLVTFVTYLTLQGNGQTWQRTMSVSADPNFPPVWRCRNDVGYDSDARFETVPAGQYTLSVNGSVVSRMGGHQGKPPTIMRRAGQRQELLNLQPSWQQSVVMSLY
jgi:hypothetical protein